MRVEYAFTRRNRGLPLILHACGECHNCGSLIPPIRIDATIGVAYYPFMAPMPQWEVPHTKVEQAQRTVGLYVIQTLKTKNKFSTPHHLVVMMYLCPQIHKNKI